VACDTYIEVDLFLQKDGSKLELSFNKPAYGCRGVGVGGKSDPINTKSVTKFRALISLALAFA